MTVSVTIAATSDDIGTERRFLEDLVLLVEKHRGPASISSAVAYGGNHGDVDLLHGLEVILEAPITEVVIVEEVAHDSEPVADDGTLGGDGTGDGSDPTNQNATYQGTGAEGASTEGDGSEADPAAAAADGWTNTTPDGGDGQDVAPSASEPVPAEQVAPSADGTTDHAAPQ